MSTNERTARLTRLRTAAVSATALLSILLAGFTLPASPAQAAGTYNNAAIANYALTFAGQTGGQCRQFVNNVVSHVSAGTQNVSSTNGGYFGAFLNAGGQEITDYNALIKGDIVQKYVSASDLHTFIIVSRDTDGLYWVVDSNSQWNEIVRHYKRTWFAGLSSTTRAFRMGTIGGGPLNGTDTFGSYNPGSATFYITNAMQPTSAEATFPYGDATDRRLGRQRHRHLRHLQLRDCHLLHHERDESHGSRSDLRIWQCGLGSPGR